MVIAARRCTWSYGLAALPLQGLPTLLTAWTSSTYVIAHSVEKLLVQGTALQDMATFWESSSDEAYFDQFCQTAHLMVGGVCFIPALPLDCADCRGAAGSRRRPRRLCLCVCHTWFLRLTASTAPAMSVVNDDDFATSRPQKDCEPTAEFLTSFLPEISAHTTSAMRFAKIVRVWFRLSKASVARRLLAEAENFAACAQ